MSTRIDWNSARTTLIQGYSAWLADTKEQRLTAAMDHDIVDDRPIARRRKRRNSSGTFAASNNAASQAASSKAPDEFTSTMMTPKKSKKRVRFSDPGPDADTLNVGSTGLTPAVARTSIDNIPIGRVQSRKQTPYRRHSTSADSSVEYRQITPMRQEVVDRRTQRRLRRNRMSEEQNNIVRDQREATKLEAQLEMKHVEVRQLREEASRLRQEMEDLAPQNSWTRLESAAPDFVFDDIGQALIPNANTDCELAPTVVTSSPSKKVQSRSKNTGTLKQPCFSDQEAQTSLQSVDLQIQIKEAKQEKQFLFNKLRPHLRMQVGASETRDLSPPPYFIDLIVDAFTKTISRADEAEHALAAFWNELKEFGFAGNGLEEIVDNLKQGFRRARLELERVVPGEMVAGFDCVKVLPALVHHLKYLAAQLHEKELELGGMKERHSVLSGQFDHTLARLENAASRITELENSIDSGAEEMLKTRMNVQKLERELKDKDVGISRLIAASNKYRDEIKEMESLFKKLENEQRDRQDASRAQLDEAVSDLECRVAAEEKGRRAAEQTSSQRADRIRELEDGVREANAFAIEIQERLQGLESEKQQTMKKMEAQGQKHEEHQGLLNVQISNLTTSLSSANAEVHKLKAIKEKLEKRIGEEMDEAQAAVEAMQTRLIRVVARNSEVKNTYIRRAKIRSVNGEVDEDEILEDRGPDTPVSMVRFVDVEVGRGKHRRKYDSGIGILSEEEIEMDDDLPEEGMRA